MSSLLLGLPFGKWKCFGLHGRGFWVGNFRICHLQNAIDLPETFAPLYEIIWFLFFHFGFVPKTCAHTIHLPVSWHAIGFSLDLLVWRWANLIKLGCGFLKSVALKLLKCCSPVAQPNFHFQSHSTKLTHLYHVFCWHLSISTIRARPSALTLWWNKMLIFYLISAMKPLEVQEKLGLTRIRDRNWYVQPSCATSGDGLCEGLTWLTSNHKLWD